MVARIVIFINLLGLIWHIDLEIKEIAIFKAPKRLLFYISGVFCHFNPWFDGKITRHGHLYASQTDKCCFER